MTDPTVQRTPLADLIFMQGRGMGEIADQAGVARLTMNRLCSGTHRPTRRTAERIARVLGTTVEEVVPNIYEPILRPNVGLATARQLARLNAAGSLKLVSPGEAKPITVGEETE